MPLHTKAGGELHRQYTVVVDGHAVASGGMPLAISGIFLVLEPALIFVRMYGSPGFHAALELLAVTALPALVALVGCLSSWTRSGAVMGHPATPAEGRLQGI